MKRTLSALVLTGAALTVTACSDGVPPQLKPQQPASTTTSAPKPTTTSSVSTDTPTTDEPTQELAAGCTPPPGPRGYSIFGKVTGGMDVIQRIAVGGSVPGSTDPSLSAPRHPISILSVSVRPK